MNAARSLAARAAPCGCLRPSRCVPGWGRERPRPPLVSKHEGGNQRRPPPGPPCWSPADRHRRLRVLRRRDRSLLWFRVRLWSGAQDSAARSCRPGRAPREDRYNDSVEGSAVEVGGFRDPEHLVRRASQPHDSSRVGVLAPAFAMPRAWRRPAPRTRRAPAVLLQFYSAAPRVVVRARDPDASDAGRFGEQAIGLERRLHGVRPPSACCCGARARCRDRPAHGI